MVNENMQRFAEKNGRYIDGHSPTYYRRATNAKPGEEVHHKDHNKANNKYSNFIKIKPGNGISAKGKHNQLHKEKLRKANKARGIKL